MNRTLMKKIHLERVKTTDQKEILLLPIVHLIKYSLIETVSHA